MAAKVDGALWMAEGTENGYPIVFMGHSMETHIVRTVTLRVLSDELVQKVSAESSEKLR